MSAAERMSVAEAELLLEGSPDHRVLKRANPHAVLVPPPADGVVHAAVFADVETTGLDVQTARIIQLGLVRVEFSASGMHRIVDQYESFNDPGGLIPPEIERLTGITDADVAGQRIDRERVRALTDGAALAVAFNSSFDRPILEAWEVGSVSVGAPGNGTFRSLPWACAMLDAPYAAYGFRTRNLSHLLSDTTQRFHDAHGALADCFATICLLGGADLGERTAFQHLYDTVKQPRARVYAFTPYEARATLKARGYTWSAGDDGRPKAWWIDLPLESYWQEEEFLVREVGCHPSDLTVRRIRARDRFTSRL